MNCHNFSKEPVRLILDTDMGNDIDDALALAMLHAMQSRGECELLGVISSKAHELSPVFIDLMNTFYGRGTIPVGAVHEGVTPNERTYLGPICRAPDRFPRSYPENGYEPSVALLRRLLSREADGSVTLLMIGFSTNIAQLFDTGADEHSPLDGRELLARKVGRVVVMAGDFSEEVQRHPTLDNREYNVHCDISASMRFFNDCPVPLTLCGYEIGLAMLYPCRSILEDYEWTRYHPLAEGYRLYKPMPYDRPMWDPAAALEAVRPGCEAFTCSPPGWVAVDEQGIMRFHEDSAGLHRYLKIVPEQLKQSVNEIVELCAQPVYTDRQTVGKGIAENSTSATGSACPSL
ncbi:nucleoside hydrolase [Ruficoccus amylovorans]|uniref:Nucleoside hydrolase n=1 Tax=Ruficoccus amylovorans TaxID=1804625 RepID=A0A842HBB4_9BACT|nr:nucleoside hydrolase [Ruficoccus amylovorans]MBC2593712.1 nucleoside hydrolase [Ruficoccus amylovorans]